MTAFAAYLAAIQRNLAHGDATEHTHRPALKTLIEALGDAITATNEPRRKTDCGAPDFSVSRKKVPFGYIETKDVGLNLAEMVRGKGPHGDQFKRYRDGLPNWILTDYLDFRWYVAGEQRLAVRLADLDAKGKLHTPPGAEEQLAQLMDGFLREPALTVETARDLAHRMAGMARILRDLIEATFHHGESQDQRWLGEWLTAFREVLIPDLNETQFADMFAQTLAYGLFAARVHTRSDKPFSREMAAFDLPKTNPFLRKLFAEIAGVDMPGTFGWAVDDIVELLKHAHLGKILKDFGRGKGKEDPVVHFYETFLAAYDPKMRELRGVYYTPEPVVSYIVRSVDHLLRTRFDRPKGLADENTLILDPAVGTATFLYFVIQQIFSQFEKQKGAWDGYVASHLLNRIFGFELLMAPYAVAHLKLGMKLQETGYRFQSDQRLGIYLTNTLEEAARRSEKLFASWISDEANAAAEIKRDKPILVVLGNPPYSGHSANRSEITVEVVRRLKNGKQKRVRRKQKTFIGQLMETYKEGCPELRKPAQAKWLQNDYVKFIRFAQWRIERTGEGILAFITDHGYLDNPTFRGMRQSLMRTFNEVYVYDLHGSSKTKEVGPEGGKDKNVFDIQQGVAIILAVRKPGHTGMGQVRRSDLWGLRDDKYAALEAQAITSTSWTDIVPGEPLYLFVSEKSGLRSEYEKGWGLHEIFNVNGDPAPGIVTTHDEFAIAFTRQEIESKVERLLRTASEEEARQLFRLCTTTQWNYDRAKEALTAGRWREEITPILYRPFDVRWTIFNPHVAVHRRERVMRHMLAGPNWGLVAARNVEIPSIEHIFCSNTVIGHHAASLKEVNFLFPLYLYDGAREDKSHGLFRGRRLNIADAIQTHGHDPEWLCAYIYAVLYSPTYRGRYAEFLRRDFPRIPLTTDGKLFTALAEKGRELIGLHLMESSKLDQFFTEFPVKGDSVIDKATYTESHRRVWINAQQYFGAVPPHVWQFHIGGYQVCEQWLKDRKGRKLDYDDLQHYQRIVVAIHETIRLMKEIDELIPAWPLP